MKIDPVQDQYANLLKWLVRIGLTLMFAAFAMYAFQVVPTGVSLEETADLWHLGATEFAAATGTELGWQWASSLPDARALALASLVLFPLGTMVLIAIAVVLYLQEKDYVFAAIAATETIVLVVAAIGIIGGGH